jgi:hypothetical protein
MTLPYFIRHHIGLKLASIAIGIVIYLHVYTDQVHDGQFWLPIALVRKPDSLAVVGEPPARALVLLRGRGKELIKLKWRSPEVEVDLVTARRGRFYHAVSTADVRMPGVSDAEVIAVLEPRLLALEFDRVTARSVPVAVRFTGAPPPGYALRGYRIVPRAVMLRGPSRFLPGPDSLLVGPVDVRGFRGAAVGLFPVARPRPELVPEPPAVEVEVAVERVATREVGGVRVRVLTAPGFAATVVPESSAVRLEGLSELVEVLAPAGLSVLLDARGLGPGGHMLAARPDTVAGVVVQPMVTRFRVHLAPAGVGIGGGLQ